MAQHNADRVAGWNDQSGERWVAHQARLDAMLAVFGQAAIEAAAPATSERVLDVGCGAGLKAVSLLSAPKLPVQKHPHSVLARLNQSHRWTSKRVGRARQPLSEMCGPTQTLSTPMQTKNETGLTGFSVG